MTRPQVILPRADSACGKLFFSDRRTADGHRIALEVWHRATGRTREGFRLAVFRCKRCWGFHIGLRPIDRRPVPNGPSANHGGIAAPQELEEAPPREYKVSRFGSRLVR